MSSIVIIGAQWGDEGKGKVVDQLADRAGMVVRYQGGNNAGHTLVVGGKKTILHLVPSGILQDDVINVIAQGVVVDPEQILREIDGLRQAGYLRDPRQLVISERAAVIMPYHIQVDLHREARLAGGKIGTTGRGIGPAYEDVIARRAVRMGDLLDEDRLRARLERVLPERNALLAWLGGDAFEADVLVERMLAFGERLRPHIGESGRLVRRALTEDMTVLFEGAQGSLLDVLHGTYPFVTSSSTLSGAVATSVGLPPTAIKRVVGVAKAYCTRVGAGPFPTELDDDVGRRLRDVGHEYGSTTGRPRRCGWLDLAALRYAHRLNGFTSLALTKLDVLTGLETLKVCVGYRCGDKELDELPAEDCDLEIAQPIYETLPGWHEDLTTARTPEDLPYAAREFIGFVERQVGVPVTVVGVGPDREHSIVIGDLLG